MKFRLWSVLFGVLFGLAAKGQPIITSVTPSFGSSSDTTPIQIHGSGFANFNLIVKFNERVASLAVATTPNLIEAFIAPGTPLGTSNVFVSVNGVGANGGVFTVIGPGPFITGFSPSIGTPMASVTITGTHFVGTDFVRFNGTNASFFVNSDTQITATAPNGVTTGPISVGNIGVGTNTTATNFFVPATITGFNPSRGRSGTNVTIRGNNFNGAIGVAFGVIPAANFVVNANTQIVATVPVGAVTAQIRVDTPVGNVFSGSNFVVQPTVFGFSPGFGPAGTSVTVTGANFNVGTPTVRFGTVNAGTPTGVSFGQLTVSVPNNATSAPITVITADGSNTSSQVFYVPARIATFSPTNGPEDTVVTINGTNFLDASAVTFNGTPAKSFNITNNNVIGAVVPAGVITGPITVTTPAGTTNSGARLFYGTPLITEFDPASGPVGTRVMLVGTNFLAASAVLFNGLSSSFTVTNNGIIGATVPGSAVSGPITVITPGGTNVTAGNFIVPLHADIGVSVTDSPDPVFVGSNLVYTIVVANNGPNPAANVLFTNTFPGSVTLKSAATSQGSLNTNGNPILGSLGTINDGAAVVVTLTVAPQVAGQILNTASAGHDNLDSGPTTNRVTTATTVWPLPVLAISALNPQQFQLSWPAALSNFTLQFNPNLAVPAGWTPVGVIPTIVGNQSIVIQTNTGTNRFFRLKQ